MSLHSSYGFLWRNFRGHKMALQFFFTFLCTTIEILIGACGYHDAGSVRHANMLSSGSWVLIKKCKKFFVLILCAQAGRSRF